MTRVMSGSGRPRLAPRIALVLVMLGGILVVSRPAMACSCAEPELAAWLREADGAFVGTAVARDAIASGRFAVTFDVEHVVKGQFGPEAIVRTNDTGGPCGLEFFGDPRTGLLLQRASDGVWESNLCSMIPASQLLAIGGDHPPDPDVAPESPGWTRGATGLLGVIVAAAIALLVIVVIRRRVSRSGASDVA